MNDNQVKWGTILSYILIVFNSLYGLIIAPFILSQIGASEYGVYKTIGALTSAVAVMEFGLGNTAQRFVAQYRAKKEEEKCWNFSAMCMIQAAVLSAGMLLLGAVLYASLDASFGATFSAAEMIRAKQIFAILIVYIALHIFENVFFGILAGYNCFTFSNGLKITSLVVKILLYLILLPIIRNSLVMVSVSLILEIVLLCIEYTYIRHKLGHRIKFYAWDKNVFRESFSYTALLFLQSLIIQFNGNIDSIVIGSVIGTSAVTVYSFAIQIFNMYEQCATAVSGVILPSVTNLIWGGATTKELENTVIKYGRMQWVVLGMALGGFVCFGKEFFWLWLGAGFEDCYYLALILMIPVTVPLIVNVCLAILKARNMLGFRTISLAYAALFNAAFTLIGTRHFGYWAAACGTAIGTIISSVISLNLYYYIKLKMNMIRIYYGILHRITPCILAACAAGVYLNTVISGSWTTFIVKAAGYCGVYGVGLMCIRILEKKPST